MPTYQTTGINLKGIPFGETDRLVTVLTPEFGIVRAIAPGARKQKSRLRGRTELFVINDLLIVQGKSLDRIIQAETQTTYAGLSKDLGKLTASQYLAEVVLCIALSEQPQVELYQLLTEHLSRLEHLAVSPGEILPNLCHGIFHLLAVAGVAPQVYNCCVTQAPIAPNLSSSNWQVGFSFAAGGIVNLSASTNQPKPGINLKLQGRELALLQQLSQPQLNVQFREDSAWVKLEQLLRNYFQFQFSKSIRSAVLLDSLFPTPVF